MSLEEMEKDAPVNSDDGIKQLKDVAEEIREILIRRGVKETVSIDVNADGYTRIDIIGVHSWYRISDEYPDWKEWESGKYENPKYTRVE